MRLVFYCKSCGHDNYLKTLFTNRFDFAMKNGKIKTVTCSKCGVANQVSVNELYATKRTKLIAFVFLSSFLATGILGYYLLQFLVKPTIFIHVYLISVLAIPSLISIFFQKGEMESVNLFNQSRISE